MKKIFFAAILIILAASGFYFYFRFQAKPGNTEKKVFKIAVINASTAVKPAFDGLKKGLSDLGLKEGEDIVYSYEDIAGSKERAQAAAAKFIKENYDLIVVTGGAIPSVVARDLTRQSAPDLPVVFAVVSNPLGLGLVKSLSSSGNNMTGITPSNETVSAKRLELFKELVPNLKRVIFPYNDPATTGIDQLRRASEDLKIELIDKKVSSLEEFDSFLDSFAFKVNDGFLRATDSLISARLNKIIDLTLNKKIPLAGTNINDVKEGALMSYGANYFEVGEQAAVLVHKILVAGEKPANIPVELPRRYELVVSLKTAKEINFSPSPDFLSRVDVIIDK